MAADYVIVGSGINALVAAALLGKKGKKVLVLERNDRIGGCIRTEEIAPGFTCDVMATTFVLFVTSPAYAALAGDLAAARARIRAFAVSDRRPAAGRAPSDFRDGPRAQHRRLRRARAGRRRALRRRNGQARRRCALPVRAARRLAMVVGHGENRRARGVEARAAQPCRLLRRSAAARPRLARTALSLSRCSARSVGALGAALRARPGKRLFRPDGESGRLRAGGRRRADRQRRRGEIAAGVRDADQGQWRRNPHLGGCRVDAARRRWRGARRQARRRQRNRGGAGRDLLDDAEPALRTPVAGQRQGRRKWPSRSPAFATARAICKSITR